MINPRLALTMGDAAGIGPEVLLRALNDLQVEPDRPLRHVKITLYGDVGVLHRTAARLGLEVSQWAIKAQDPLPENHPVGTDSAITGNAAFMAVKAAATDAMTGLVDAVITSPLSKAAMNLAGHRYPGHTEILAEIAGQVPVRMMLANDELAVVLDSIHVPLAQAVADLNESTLLQTIKIAHAHFKKAGFTSPRIAVAGLNPHAGEGGLLGSEEMRIIGPAIARAKQLGIGVDGPFAPDTVFMQARGFARFDVVIAMYHDQGLIPVKYMGLDAGVNITIGLPFVRTSPDHGTAYDLAGKGTADPASMRAAIRSALRQVERRGAQAST